MADPLYRKALLSCGFFFIGTNLPYGLITARLPALRAHAGAGTQEIGLFLFLIGLSALVTLLTGARLVARWGSRRVLPLALSAACLVTPLAGCARGLYQLYGAAVLLGGCFGLLDIALNAQAIVIERRFAAKSLATMHACASAGGIAGALGASLCAACGWGPGLNFTAVMALCALFIPAAGAGLLEDYPGPAGAGGRRGSRLRDAPPAVYLCGLLCLGAYISEGSAADWGSLLLVTCKGAAEADGALAYAAFCASAIAVRLVSDRLRRRVPESRILLGGIALACGAMALILSVSDPRFCLALYALMGLGLGPAVPLLFSLAGRTPGVRPVDASALVGTFAYTGLLFCPPCLGWLAGRIGLDRALIAVPAVLALMALGTLGLRAGRPSDGRAAGS